MINDKIPKVLELVVKNDLCIGCGLCVYKCPSNALKMNWNEYGFLAPELSGTCDSNGECLTVCPFNPYPDDKVKTENELAQLFFKDQNSHPKIGQYIGIYAGYAKKFRLNSSSGGIATYISIELLNQKIVDYIISVKKSPKSELHYEYSVNHTKEELVSASQTRYYPVTLSNVLTEIHNMEGKVAITGVACFIKAIRLAQYQNPILKNKIKFLIGIICGGMKSLFFTEYLVNKAGVSLSDYQNPQYRIKNTDSSARDYSFGCFNKKSGIRKTIRMQSVGDMWGTGLFKANPCDFCDDVTTELADISLGDAWLEPYHKDGKGTNVVITRTKLAEKLIINGKAKEELYIEKLNKNRFLKSQKGSFNHRHTGQSFRIKYARKRNKLVPPKRFENEKVTFDFKIVQLLRMKIRKTSLEIWKNNSNSAVFERKLNVYLKALKIATIFYHYKKIITNKLKNL
jgi:coenzyme F420 hydrogenase subunit beta